MATKTPTSNELALLLLPALVAAHPAGMAPTSVSAREVIDASIAWAETIRSAWKESGYTLDNIR
jgi:hypothetical protein